MGKQSIILLLCSMVIATPLVHGVDEGPQAVEEWFKNLSQQKEKVTKLHFYFHDTISGKTPTAVVVAYANAINKGPNTFGSISVLDDPLTVGPEPNSTIVGRAQGIYGEASLEEIGLLMTFNFVFTSGVYNGSTLSVLGRNPILNQYREMPIVGGSGVFRLARGIVTAKTYTFNSNGDAIVEYNVVVLHY